jgi:two-component sensor histidine kinase
MNASAADHVHGEPPDRGAVLALVPPPSHVAIDLPEVLFAELQHRTNNVLNNAWLLLDTALRRCETAEARSELAAIAHSFHLLLHANRSVALPDPDAAGDPVEEIVSTCDSLGAAFRVARPGIRFDTEIEAPGRGSVRPAGALRMIVTELVHNAYKHAFRARDSGRLRVRLMPTPAGGRCLSVEDDGAGFVMQDASRGGMRIVASLASAIGGRVVVVPGTGGARVQVEFGLPRDGQAPSAGYAG